MSRFLALLGFLSVLGLASCRCPEQAAFVSFEASWKVIGPRYVTYVKADPTLTDQDKVDRITTATLLDQVIVEAKAARAGTTSPAPVR